MNLAIEHWQEQGDGSGGEFVWVRRLMAAVLDAAAYSLGRKKGFNFTRLDGLSGWQYVMRGSRAWPLSFESLCDHFDLNPGRVRTLVNEHPAEILARRVQGRNDLLPPSTVEESDA